MVYVQDIIVWLIFAFSMIKSWAIFCAWLEFEFKISKQLREVVFRIYSFIMFFHVLGPLCALFGFKFLPPVIFDEIFIIINIYWILDLMLFDYMMSFRFSNRYFLSMLCKHMPLFVTVSMASWLIVSKLLACI